jgi:hypothetical protein
MERPALTRKSHTALVGAELGPGGVPTIAVYQSIKTLNVTPQSSERRPDQAQLLQGLGQAQDLFFTHEKARSDGGLFQQASGGLR